MPTLKNYRIAKAVVTVQWRGYWHEPNWQPGSNNQGSEWPGIQIPDSLQEVAASLQSGGSFTIDLELGKWEELRRIVAFLFPYHVRGRGPAGGEYWTLLGKGDTTTSNHIKWVPSGQIDSLGYAIGTSTSPSRKEMLYDFGTGNVGYSSFLLLIVFAEA